MKSMELFGMALKNYYEGNKESSLTIHNTGGRSNILSIGMFFREPDFFEIDKTALSLCKGAILDIGAGTGDHTIFLQNKGYDVTALDIVNDSCEIMKRRGITKVLCCDIFSFATLEKYDTILLLGRSIGAVANCNGFFHFLKTAKNYLTKCGQIIFNSMNNPSKDQWQSRQMRFEYQKEIGDIVDWFGIGENLVSQFAMQNGYHCEIKMSENDGNYLSVLQMKMSDY